MVVPENIIIADLLFIYYQRIIRSDISLDNLFFLYNGVRLTNLDEEINKVIDIYNGTINIIVINEKM